MAARKKITKDSAKSDNESIVPRDYADWLASLKSHVSGARQRATLAVNQELVRRYHHIGTEILERQTRQGWGAKVIDRLAVDLRAAIPEMKGFSSRNLKYMKFFAQMCPAGRIGQRAAAQLPWFHIVTPLYMRFVAQMCSTGPIGQQPADQLPWFHIVGREEDEP